MTVSINGFGDPIYAKLPVSAQLCVEESTGITPCQYWDIRCLCVMSNWGGGIAECVSSACSGSEVVVITSLANSICSSAGIPSLYWNMRATASCWGV